MSKDYRESATAHIATAINDFPDIETGELFKYVTWLGYEIEYNSVGTIASAVRTTMNLNKIGCPRRERLPVSNRRYLSTLKKTKTH